MNLEQTFAFEQWLYSDESRAMWSCISAEYKAAAQVWSALQSQLSKAALDALSVEQQLREARDEVAKHEANYQAALKASEPARAEIRRLREIRDDQEREIVALKDDIARRESCAVSMEAVCGISSEICLLNESEESDGEDDMHIQFELMPRLKTALREWRLKRNASGQPQTPCIHKDAPEGCYRVRCQLGKVCVDDDLSPRNSQPLPGGHHE